jgi:hypothetical protein
MELIYFRAWVANTVYAISGIWAYDWRGSERKWLLTSEEIRMAACQEVSERYLHVLFQASALDSRLGTTNKRVLH